MDTTDLDVGIVGILDIDIGAGTITLGVMVSLEIESAHHHPDPDPGFLRRGRHLELARLDRHHPITRYRQNPRHRSRHRLLHGRWPGHLALPAGHHRHQPPRRRGRPGGLGSGHLGQRRHRHLPQGRRLRRPRVSPSRPTCSSSATFTWKANCASLSSASALRAISRSRRPTPFYLKVHICGKVSFFFFDISACVDFATASSPPLPPPPPALISQDVPAELRAGDRVRPGRVSDQSTPASATPLTPPPPGSPASFCREVPAPFPSFPSIAFRSCR